MDTAGYEHAHSVLSIGMEMIIYTSLCFKMLFVLCSAHALVCPGVFMPGSQPIQLFTS